MAPVAVARRKPTEVLTTINRGQSVLDLLCGGEWFVRPRSASSHRVTNSIPSGPLSDMYQRAAAANPSRWVEVKDYFLSAMWDFDQDFGVGKTNEVRNQNHRGDFFRDLTALILKNCSGKELYGRSGIPGLIFPNQNLDTSYPKTGAVEVLIETKVAGAPKSIRNPQQRNPKGRPGSSDLDKRIKEVGLKTIDLKGEWARHSRRGEEPTSNLLTWLHESKPRAFLFLAIRVVDSKDFERTLFFANAANQMMDAVGLVVYEQSTAGDAYQSRKVPPHLELDRVLSRVCTALRILP